MRLPNWFKIGWWLLLTGMITWFLYKRYPALVAGEATCADIVAFVVWIALLLALLFSEVSLLGVTFKQKAEELKKFVATQMSEIRSEIRNAVDVRTTFNPRITIPAPPTDSQLPGLEAIIKATISDALASHSMQPYEAAPSVLRVSEDVSFLFATRYNIERELRRLVYNRDIAPTSRKPLPILQLSQMLVGAGLIEPRLVHAIHEVYAICTPAIHGEHMSDAQIKFVKDVGPELVTALKAIS